MSFLEVPFVGVDAVGILVEGLLALAFICVAHLITWSSPERRPAARAHNARRRSSHHPAVGRYSL